MKLIQEITEATMSRQEATKAVHQAVEFGEDTAAHVAALKLIIGAKAADAELKVAKALAATKAAKKKKVQESVWGKQLSNTVK